MDNSSDNGWTSTQVKEYIEALLVEHQRATEMAERERSKAADALNTEKRAAATTAERERDKRAEALAVQLRMQMEQGDTALKDHIEQQIRQLESLLSSTRREIDIRVVEQQKAIDKSEGSYDKRFEGINALRGQMSDLMQAHQKSLTELTGSLMPREVAESQITAVSNRVDANAKGVAQGVPRETFDRAVSEWSEWRSGVEQRLNQQRGQGEGAAKQTANATRLTTIAIGLGSLLVSVVLVIGDVLTP